MKSLQCQAELPKTTKRFYDSSHQDCNYEIDNCNCKCHTSSYEDDLSDED